MKSVGALLTEADLGLVSEVLGTWRDPDLIITAKNGRPFLYRWHLIPRYATKANVYLHVQCQSDPDRPMHDHPYDNCSVLLAGRYTELLDTTPEKTGHTEDLYHRGPGDVIWRKAEWAHRIVLPKGVPYSISIFTTGPPRRVWGFHASSGFLPHTEYAGCGCIECQENAT